MYSFIYHLLAFHPHLFFGPFAKFCQTATPQLFVQYQQLSNETIFAAVGAGIGELYWYNRFLAFVFYYIRCSRATKIFFSRR